jgi:uncharacterized protein YycO
MVSWNPKFLYFCTPLIRAVKDLNWRFGRQFRCSGPDIDRVMDLHSPGMVVLSHREYQFTNLFIEGYWTHTAMIMPRGQVIEAIGEGVVMRDLHSFLSTVDDFVILRPKFCGSEEMEMACHHAAGILGAPYSFDFNNSDTEYYCSKLVLKAYARSCGWKQHNHSFPEEFRNLCEGRIVHPSEIYRNSGSWEVVCRLN